MMLILKKKSLDMPPYGVICNRYQSIQLFTLFNVLSMPRNFGMLIGYLPRVTPCDSLLRIKAGHVERLGCY